MNITKNTPVRFMGERFRVVRVLNKGRDLIIQNVEGHRMTVGVLSVQEGW